MAKNEDRGTEMPAAFVIQCHGLFVFTHSELHWDLVTKGLAEPPKLLLLNLRQGKVFVIFFLLQVENEEALWTYRILY